ncbi:MAG TPA: FHA domain-containing protein [Bdellovibrionota bacterium]|nr:FHA domain-containing protein [Bdellovibrionota bacterium]
MPKFTVKLAGNRQASFIVEGSDIFVGRVPAINDICIEDPSVSRQHAHIKKREEGYTIYDLKSLNGVILNGARVSRAVLKDGDEIRLGDATMTVQLRQESEEEELNAIEQSEATKSHVRIVQDEVTKKTVAPRIGRKKRSKKSK